MRRPILNHIKRGDVVYDPFLGSGTTLMAAELTERICFGIELDPKYCDVIVQRWQQFTGKEATSMERSGRSTTSPPSECPLSPEIERCEREIAAAEEALRAGHRDVAGLCLALSDWSAERRILRTRTRPGVDAVKTEIRKGI